MADTTPISPTPATPRRGDYELLAAYRQGDRRAAELLVERTYELIFGALFKLTCGDRELAADLTQETYRRAWQNLDQFKGRSRVATWLYRIAYTTFLNHVRRPRTVVAGAPEVIPEPSEPGPTPEDQAAESAADRRLRRAVLALGDDLRFVVTARYWGEQKLSEIARDQGITTTAVRKRIQKALRILAQALQEETR
jgi:RNA polymerase sigma factor (sigma-70 family)